MDERTYRLKLMVLAEDAKAMADRAELLEALAEKNGWSATAEALFASRVKATYIHGRLKDELDLGFPEVAPEVDSSAVPF